MLATVLQLGYPDSLSSIGHLNFYRSSFGMKTEQQLYHWKKHVSLKFHGFQASFFLKINHNGDRVCIYIEAPSVHACSSKSTQNTCGRNA